MKQANETTAETPAASLNRRRLSTRYRVPHPVYGWFIGHMTLGTVVVALLLGGFLWQYRLGLLQTLEASGLMDSGLGPVVTGHSTRLFNVSVLVLGIFVVWTLLLSSFLFHRVAGPMYRLSKHLRRQLSSPESVERLSFRDTDQFREVAELVNQITATRSDAGHAGHGRPRSEP